DRVAGFHQPGELGDRVLGDLAGGQHHPGGPFVFAQRADQLAERRGRHRTFARQRLARRRIGVVDAGGMAGAHQAPHNVAAHPAETDDSDFHRPMLHTIERRTIAMKLGRLGVWYSADKCSASQVADLVKAVERNGYSAYWYPESRGFE